jgi:hypothetical protein
MPVDLDSVVLSVPSAYAPRTLGDTSSANTSSASSSGSPPPSQSGAASENGNGGVSNAPLLLNPLLFLVLGVMWVLRPVRR